jgi:hypothetical protein
MFKVMRQISAKFGQAGVAKERDIFHVSDMTVPSQIFR